MKQQAYTCSCFPCSLHMGLVNLGYKKVKDKDEDDVVEMYFNDVCKIKNNNKSLDIAGPLSVEQLFDITDEYLGVANIKLKQSNRFYTKDGANTIHIGNLLRWNDEPRFAAIIANYNFMGHATLLIKNENYFVYIHTSTDAGATNSSSDYGENIQIIPPMVDNEYSLIKFNGFSNKEGKEDVIISGDVVFIFN